MAKPKLTAWQRLGMWSIRRETGLKRGEPLRPEDWELIWRLHEAGAAGVFHRFLRRLPHSPRCRICGAPFAGAGRFLAGALGYRPSRKNPTVCATCVEFSPPGGMTMWTGVLFADLRGFTARCEGLDPEETSRLLRRFYAAAEDVLFPDAVIDKLIGDEVMALYLPDLRKVDRAEIPEIMVADAGALLDAVGYGSPEGPFAELGIGLDFGEAFVGNIGQRALYDFTAVGDVVNTASRLQGQAAGGEIVMSERVAGGLGSLPGAPVDLELKGKSEVQRAYRLRRPA